MVCFVVTRSLKVLEYLRSDNRRKRHSGFSEQTRHLCFYRTGNKAPRREAAPSTTVHGVLMDVMGVGILIVGEARHRQDENALELITRATG